MPMPSLTDTSGKHVSYKTAFRRFAVALGLANDTIEQLGQCYDDQRSAYQNYH